MHLGRYMKISNSYCFVELFKCFLKNDLQSLHRPLEATHSSQMIWRIRFLHSSIHQTSTFGSHRFCQWILLGRVQGPVIEQIYRIRIGYFMYFFFHE